ncbi:MAG: glycosyltransferase [Gammaproteobacteria bacterium]|nr:glycosyltransferase [Gammaproteobacteria bacterium]
MQQKPRRPFRWGYADMVMHRAKRIRRPRDVWWFLRWLRGVARLRLGGGSTAPLEVRSHPPSVSITMATNRPDFLAWAVENVRRQHHRPLELVLALHGEGFDDGKVKAELARLAIPAKVVHVDVAANLGEALTAATAEATGELITKMDDDDLYGSEHISHLVSAWRKTGARLVGKLPEWSYLCGHNVSISRYTGTDARHRYRMSGGTMMIRRADLARIGGWRSVPRRVDTWLMDDVIASGGMVHRATGRGYVVIRHGQGHTNDRDEKHYLGLADYVADGWRPSLAGILEVDDAPSFPGFECPNS